MIDKFSAMRIATSDLQWVRSLSAGALVAYKLIAASNLIGGVNGGRQRGQPSSASQKRSALRWQKAESAFPRNLVSASHEAFDGKRIFEGEVGHTTLDDTLVLIP
jgi:hypothetical protein